MVTLGTMMKFATPISAPPLTCMPYWVTSSSKTNDWPISLIQWWSIKSSMTKGYENFQVISSLDSNAVYCNNSMWHYIGNVSILYTHTHTDNAHLLSRGRQTHSPRLILWRSFFLEGTTIDHVVGIVAIGMRFTSGEVCLWNKVESSSVWLICKISHMKHDFTTDQKTLNYQNIIICAVLALPVLIISFSSEKAGLIAMEIH